MSKLRYLNLQGNQFSGPIPNAMANSSLLLTLDLMNNKFSGEIPSWIGTFSNLRILLLKGNNLEGSIPTVMCQLRHISILDLSHNTFSGEIPSCLNDASSGLLDPLDNIIFGEYFIMFPIKFTKYISENLLHVDNGIDIQGLVSDEEQEVEFMSKSRLESYKGNILYYMSGIDLSCNMLTGAIPHQIGNLSSIHTLNLSNNHLSGPIPETFSNLKQVESLDLSHNKLVGHIPSKLVELYSLSIFSVAYNNLSGTTPETKYQFATFGESSYEGNPLLCGPPLQHSCTSISGGESVMHSDLHAEENEFRDNFMWSFAATFVVSFLSVIVIVYFNPYFVSRNFHA
ncbi:cuscuta receptor 1-like [Arachis stenosperma]|uniref:cuscuta receptor 1-like n=1 Tax=Arachis stenosperma TaxID=217475 RepID=UPI0025ABBAEC|nr:cuscuta receptor 1-like [Arachis stenosperma]